MTDDFARARATAALCPRSAASGLIAYLGRLLSGCVRVLAIARRGDFAVRHEDRTKSLLRETMKLCRPAVGGKADVKLSP